MNVNLCIGAVGSQIVVPEDVAASPSGTGYDVPSVVKLVSLYDG